MTELPSNATLAERIDRALDSDPVKLRDALYAVLDRLDAEVAGAKRQMAMGDYRLCPPDMLRIATVQARRSWRASMGGSDDPRG